MVRGAGAGREVMGAVRGTDWGGLDRSGARGTAALERLGHGAQTIPRTLVDARAKHGERERARGGQGQAGGAARARAAVAVRADGRRRGAMALARDARV